MFKRILTLALAVSFVAPVVAKPAETPAQPVKTSVIRTTVLSGVVATLAAAGALLADSKYNDGRGSKQLVKIATNAKNSQAYQVAVTKLAALYVASVAYVAQTSGYQAAATFVAQTASRLRALKLSRVVAPVVAVTQKVTAPVAEAAKTVVQAVA